MFHTCSPRGMRVSAQCGVSVAERGEADAGPTRMHDEADGQG